MKIYFAAPLFSLNERSSNRRLAAAIEKLSPGVKVLLPQDLKFHNQFNAPEFFGEVYAGCLKLLEDSDVIVAILDGPSADDGTAYEVGYAVAKGKPVIGIRTDYRDSQERGMNLMLSRGCSAIVHRPAFDEDFDALAKDIGRKLKQVMKPKSEK